MTHQVFPYLASSCQTRCMKKLMFSLFVMASSSISQLVWGSSNLLKLAGVEVYAWDSEKKLKIEQMDMTVLEYLKEEFKKNGKNFESILVRDQKIFVFRGKNTNKDNILAAFDINGEILQYSGPLTIKAEGKNEARVEFVDLVKM